jgi:hypothetical protein
VANSQSFLVDPDPPFLAGVSPCVGDSDVGNWRRTAVLVWLEPVGRDPAIDLTVILDPIGWVDLDKADLGLGIGQGLVNEISIDSCVS